MYDDTNQICADLWKRGQKTTDADIRVVTHGQIENAVGRFMQAEDRLGPSVRELKSADTDRWEISPTMNPAAFLILKR